MTIDISQFRETYFEESFEGLQIMEQGLLELQEGTPDSEQINTIFRAAHSIKGGAGTYGLEDVGRLTHVMETLLDDYRTGQSSVDASAVQTLLTAVDCVREMFAIARNNEQTLPDEFGEIVTALESFLQVDDEASGQPAAPEDTSDATGPSAQVENLGGWHVSFTPGPDLLRSGNDPLRLLRCMRELGVAQVHVDDSDLPPWQELDPHECYASWSVKLSDEVSREDIEEIFEWVDDLADIEIRSLASENSDDDTPDEANPDTVATQDQQGEQSTDTSTAEVPSAETLPPTTASEESAAENSVIDDATTAAPAAAAEALEAPPVASVAPPSPAKAPASTAAAPNETRTPRRRAGSQESGSIRVNIDKVDALINMVGELVITQSMLSQVGQEYNPSEVDRLKSGLIQLERNTRELQESVMRIRMVPMSFAFGRLPRVVHDVAGKLGKQVELAVEGEQTELDKTVMERIHDPLVHIVRNSLDHGLEAPAERLAAGKSATGTVSLNAYHHGGSIVIEISDDGRGLDVERILAKARERGILAEGETLPDSRATDLIFAPGFSTAAEVTDVSGRGVGMDVVKRNIDDLGGSISVETSKGVGTTIAIRLPLTLAILDGQTVTVGDEKYILPLNSIIETIQLRDDAVSHLANGQEIFRLREEYLRILRLDRLFAIDGAAPTIAEGLLVVVESGSEKIGLFVDELLSQQQIVIKSLETNYHRVDGLSGATILGDGRVALILDVAGLMRIANEGRQEQQPPIQATQSTPEAPSAAESTASSDGAAT